MLGVDFTFSFQLLFIYSFIFLLEYSCFTLPILLYSKVNQSYTYIYPLFPGFISHLYHHTAPKDFSVLCIRFSLVIYFMHSSVYMSITFFQFTPSPISPWYPYVCSLCVCLYFCFANQIISTIFLHSTCIC